MARKIVNHTVSDEKSRDFGKTFQITEMSAYDGEKWCMRAVNAIIKSGLNLPDNVLDFPSETIAILGITNFLKIDPETLEVLMVEMLDTIKIITMFEGKKSDPRPLLNNGDDIEEINTLVELRKEFFKVNLNFLWVAGSQIMAELLPTQS